MTNFWALRAKTHLFLIDEYTNDDYEKNKIINKKAKETKKCVIKRERSYLITMLMHCLKMKYCWDHNIDLKVIIKKCTQKRLIR